MIGIRIALLLLLTLSTLSVAADTRRFQSSANQVTLLELYTSEGCSSCPPADRWLSGLKDDPRLWRQLIPVAFHVDYWDTLGWPDRLADPRYSERQRNYARHGLLSTVYTPGLVLNGREWRGWFFRPRLKLEPAAMVGKLELITNSNHATAIFMPHDELQSSLELHLAVLGFDLSTPVSAGENQGRILNHDFVVLGYRTVALPQQGDHYRTNLALPKPRFEAPRQAIAIWVTRTDDPRPLQATGGWLPSN